jgi:hypothetical protein
MISSWRELSSCRHALVRRLGWATLFRRFRPEEAEELQTAYPKALISVGSAGIIIASLWV